MVKPWYKRDVKIEPKVRADQLRQDIESRKVGEVEKIKKSIAISGAGTYASKTTILHAKVASEFIGATNFVCGAALDSEKVNLELLKKIEAGFLQRLLDSKDITGVLVQQINSNPFPFGGEIDRAFMQINESNIKAAQVEEYFKEATRPSAGALGMLMHPAPKAGATDIVVGNLTFFRLKESLRINSVVELKPITVPAERVKQENQRIVMAHEVLRGMPSCDGVVLQDNNLANGFRPLPLMDIMLVLLLQVHQEGERVKGNNDFADMLIIIKKDGNGLILPAATTFAIPTEKRRRLLILKEEVLLRDPAIAALAELMSTVCTERGFDKYGFVKASKTMPVSLAIGGPIPIDIVRKAASLAQLPENVSVFFHHLPLDDVLVSALHTTLHSIDSIDKLFHIQDGVRPVHTLGDLIPRDVAEAWAERRFPRSQRTYDNILRKIAELTDVDEDEVRRTI